MELFVLGSQFQVGECEGQKVVDGHPVPLVLLPGGGGSGVGLAAALEANMPDFEAAFQRSGAVLFRGFGVGDAAEFGRVVAAAGWDDCPYMGPAVRTRVGERVWTANEGPLSEAVYFHHEMVLIEGCPSKVILFCEVAPPEGGETPVVPSWRVTERMVAEFPEAVRAMEEKGLMYTFFFPSKTNDATSIRGRCWEEAFGTSDRTEAQLRAKAKNMGMEWLPDGGAKVSLGPHGLTRDIPGRKGKKAWFNAVDGLYGKATSSAEMADGEEIPAEMVRRLLEIEEEESVQFGWEKGDVLFLDNIAVLHGRRPSLPPRRILASLCK